MKKDRKFVLNVAEEEVNVEDYRHNQNLLMKHKLMLLLT
jgi:hypothetical protein